MYGLLLLPPVFGLIFEPDGMRHPIPHQLRSLAAIWLYVALCGSMIHAATWLISRTTLSLLRRRGAMLQVVAAQLSISITTLVAFQPLVSICEGLAGRFFELLTRGLLLRGLSELYRELVHLGDDRRLTVQQELSMLERF